MTEASWTERCNAAAMVWDTTPDPLVVAACRGLRPGRALNLVAGEGRNAIWLAGRGWTVTAVDSDGAATSRISARAALQGVRLDAITADVIGYHPAPGGFDLVLLSYPQLTLDQLRRLLRHAAGALAPSGRLLLVGYDASNLDAGYGGPGNPDLLATPELVAGVLTGCGLRIERAEVVQREVPVEVGIRIALDHVVTAVRPAD